MLIRCIFQFELQVIAIDPDIERLQIARTKYSASNIEYRVGGAESIPMGDYDIIYSSNVLHWCKDKDLVFKQISKTLKIGGQLGIIVTGTKDYNIGEILFQPTDLLLDPAHRQHMMDQIHPFSPRLITNLATSHGFEIMYLNEHWQKWKFEDIQKLIKFYLTNWKYQGVFAENDFDLGAIEKHFRGREIVVNIPYITAVAKKMK